MDKKQEEFLDLCLEFIESEKGMKRKDNQDESQTIKIHKNNKSRRQYGIGAVAFDQQ